MKGIKSVEIVAPSTNIPVDYITGKVDLLMINNNNIYVMLIVNNI